MLAHYEAGDPENPLVTLAHGVCDVSLQWVDLMKHLSSKYFVIAFDSLGHGLSPRYSAEELEVPGDSMMNALEEALDYQEKLHGKKAVMIAHSMGAAVSSKLATYRPDLFTGLILEDPAWLSDEQAEQYKESADEQVENSKVWRSDCLASLKDNVALRPHWDVPSQSAWVYGKSLVDPALLKRGIVSFPEPWREIAAKISVPTLVLTSDTDEVLIGTDGAQAIRDLGNPALSVEILPGTSHGLRLDAPQAYEKLVDAQLAQWIG